jgi:hypothetical protein
MLKSTQLRLDLTTRREIAITQELVRVAKKTAADKGKTGAMLVSLNKQLEAMRLEMQSKDEELQATMQRKDAELEQAKERAVAAEGEVEYVIHTAGIAAEVAKQTVVGLQTQLFDKNTEMARAMQQGAAEEVELLQRLESLQAQLEWQATALDEMNREQKEKAATPLMSTLNTTTISTTASTSKPSQGVIALQAAVAPKTGHKWKKVAACFAIAVLASASQNPGMSLVAGEVTDASIDLVLQCRRKLGHAILQHLTKASATMSGLCGDSVRAFLTRFFALFLCSLSFSLFPSCSCAKCSVSPFIR